MALNTTTRPNIRARVLPRVPATLQATGGLGIEKVNGVWTFHPEFTDLVELTVLTTPTSKDVWVWDPVTDTYNVMTLAAVGSSLFTATSTSSVAIGTGSKTFTTQAGKLFPVNSTLVISSDADPTTDYLVAQVTSYSGTTLTVNVPTGGNNGSGTHTDWTISLSGPQGATGDAATIAAGTTTTLAEGSSATVANSGSSSAAVFDFGIPRGATPAIGFTFDATSTADSDPGAGKVKFNNATPASITAIYFDNADADGNTVTTWLDSFDDSTNTAKGTLIFTDVTAPATKIIFSVSGSVVDGTGYRKVTVAHVSGATLFTTAHRLAVQFSRAGDKGTDGAGTGDVTGPAASVDSEIALFSSTTGKVIKRASMTGLVKAASGVASAATAGSDYMHPGTTSTVTKGFTITPNNIGTVSSGTTTPDPSLGNYQYYTNNGAHTLAAPSSDCAIDILVTNGASAGAITFSGFTVGANVGDALTTTNTHKFIISIRRINSVATYLIKALQ